MQKLDMQTPDITEANIEKIAKLFPSVITEAEDDKGNLVRKVDFDLLRQELSKEIVEDTTERYRLDRPGKKRSLLKANTPIDKTLRPIPSDSVNWDTTQNLYLEGDNFEVLKVLQESYLGKIKIIYIDPPYNTGKDFVYKDNFKVSKDDYEEELGAKDEEGGKLFKNTDTNGRYHSDWLSMMYERLTVARDLLTDDGVIFMSIDDNEVHNLRKIADEIFGEDNFITNLSIENNPKGRKNSSHISVSHESCLIYSRNKEKSGFKEIIKKENLECDSKGYYTNGKRVLIGESSNDQITSIEDNKNYSVYYSEKLNKFKTKKEKIEEVDNNLIEAGYRVYKSIRDNILLQNTYTEQTINTLFLEGDLIFKENTIYEKDRNVYSRLKSLIKTSNQFDLKTETAGAYLEKLGIPFSMSKNIGLLTMLISLFEEQEGIILDFFSGSATTSDACMRQNISNNGNRRYICIQLQENLDIMLLSADTNSKKIIQDGIELLDNLGRPHYITEIGKERIRRAGKKILEENKDKEGIENLDIGFRVYKTDTTNMKDVYYHPSKISQDKLSLFVDNIKEDRTPEDLLTQVILDLGLTLDLPIESKIIKGNTVFFVANNSVVACFDAKIDFAIVDEIAAIKPLKVVFRDSCFADDKDRINVETRMKRLSPDTIVNVI